MTERQYYSICNNMLEIIDECPNGVPLLKLEEIMRQAISFAVLVRGVNYLRGMGLIEVDANHVAWRVRE